ncbi:MAG: peptide deformylase [Candidatus Paceibacterota bacterium]
MAKNQKIIQAEDKTLRAKAKEVKIDEITSPAIKKILEQMKKSLEKESDGVAIAAPQIAVSLRIFVISKRAFEITTGKDGEFEDQVFINPIITKLSKEKEEMEEGCLSVRWKYGKVMRSEKATIKAYDENGKKFTRGASGLIAQIFQHETDHLDGVLFIDKAKDVVDLPPKG